MQYKVHAKYMYTVRALLCFVVESYNSILTTLFKIISPKPEYYW